MALVVAGGVAVCKVVHIAAGQLLVTEFCILIVAKIWLADALWQAAASSPSHCYLLVAKASDLTMVTLILSD